MPTRTRPSVSSTRICSPVRAAVIIICAACLTALACRAPGGGDATGDASKAEAAKAEKAEAPKKPGRVDKNHAELPPLPEIVATVDGQPIPLREFEIRYE